MKPSQPLGIYIASSFRNLHAVHMLRDALTDRGHTVMDWTAFAPLLPEGMRPEERRSVLDSDSRGKIFEFCTGASGGADLVIYLGESGQDAACEVGIAWGSGVPVYGLAGFMEKPGLMLTRAVEKWFPDSAALLAGVEAFAEELREPHSKI